MFARGAVETRKALIDCGATRSVVSWEGTGTHECAKITVQLVFLGPHREDMVHFLQLEQDNRVKERSHSM